MYIYIYTHSATGQKHMPRVHVPMLSDLDRKLDPEGLEQ